ncbi:hypothetical protein [Pedobacter rhizosphaerae]|uniref:Uncharacterized protein n=1 Tax=Pedobacter rhizosphaerae TaxID=390241 RepID=A0A1H9VZ75_9SPHI|nr:hypothetical protein [Pedobacter rhizosphaerae]SES26952.1 hypothetical protein SAMN04488023_1538 [Pedobacter rhizosphaerae]
MDKFKILLLLSFLLVFNLAQAQLSTKEIAVLKSDMVKAVENAKLTDSLFKKLDKLPNKTALITGYTGTLEALKAKHSWNPYNKIKFVSRSLKTMKKAIGMDKENMEIRFMRFSIEHFTPSFLGFSKDLEVDRKEIVKHYQNHNFGLADEALVKNVAKFMVDSKRCTPDEIKVLKKYY